jgi:hypothetical protein
MYGLAVVYSFIVLKSIVAMFLEGYRWFVYSLPSVEASRLRSGSLQPPLSARLCPQRLSCAWLGKILILLSCFVNIFETVSVWKIENFKLH